MVENSRNSGKFCRSARTFIKLLIALIFRSEIYYRWLLSCYLKAIVPTFMRKYAPSVRAVLQYLGKLMDIRNYQMASHVVVSLSTIIQACYRFTRHSNLLHASDVARAR